MLPTSLAQPHGAAACIQRGWRASSSRAEAERRRLAFLIVHADTDFFLPLAWLRSEGHEWKEPHEVKSGLRLQATGDWSKSMVESWSQLAKCQRAAASIQRGWRMRLARAEAERRRLAFLIVHSSSSNFCWPLVWLQSDKQSEPLCERTLTMGVPSHSARHHGAAACIQRGWRVWSARAEAERRRLAFLIVTSNADVCQPLAWLQLEQKEPCEHPRRTIILMVQRFLRAWSSHRVVASKAQQRATTVEAYELQYLHHCQEWGRREIERQEGSSRQDLDALLRQNLNIVPEKGPSHRGDMHRRLQRPRPMSSIGERQCCIPSPKAPPPRSPVSPSRLSATQRSSPNPMPATRATLSPTCRPHSELLLSAESGSRPLWASNVSTHVYRKSSSKTSHLPPLERAFLSTPTNSRPSNAIIQRSRTSVSGDESIDAFLLDLPSPTAQSNAAATSLPPAAVLDRSGEGLRDSQVQPLLQSLCGVHSIQKLAISHNKLTDASLRELLPVLAHPGCALRILELAGNQFTKASLRPFFDIIGSVNRTVEVLDLSGCLRDNSSHRLMVALQGNYHLQTLVLDGNQIGEEGVAALVAMLKNPGCALTSLSLANNAINNRAARQLLGAIRGNAVLTHLRCHGNPCSEVYLQEMGFLMEMNCGNNKPSRGLSPCPVPRGASPMREQTEAFFMSPNTRKRYSIGRSPSRLGVSPRREQTDLFPLSPTSRKRNSMGRPPGLAGGQQTFAGNFVRNRHNLSPTVWVR